MSVCLVVDMYSVCLKIILGSHIPNGSTKFYWIFFISANTGQHWTYDGLLGSLITIRELVNIYQVKLKFISNSNGEITCEKI